MRLTTTKLSFILASLCALSAIGCDDGGDDDSTDNMGMAGAGSGGGGNSGPKASTLKLTNFEEGEFNGYFKDEGKGWEAAWFTYADTTAGAMITPALMMPFQSIEDAARPEGNRHVANMKGGGFTEWGAGMGVNLKTGTPPGTVNLTAYKGIGFWARGTVTGSAGGVSVKLVDARNTLPTNGGTCVAVAPMRCEAVPEAPLALTPEWKYHEIRFADFKTPAWRMTPSEGAQLEQVHGFQFQVGIGAVFDLSVDELGLLTE